jgi:hypothetical protein
MIGRGYRLTASPTTAIIPLPPLILHPFGGSESIDDLLAGSKAMLALEGFTGAAVEGDERYELRRRALLGRYQEIRMLLFLGKDISRWLQQCVDFARRSDILDTRLSEQSFADLVVENPPENVKLKLQKWGVTDRRAIFSRAIGIYSLFIEPPPLSSLAPTFLNHYHRYADHAYICFQHLRPFHSPQPEQFGFELYASEEYSRLLSAQWERV